MDVILLEEVYSLGNPGDIVNVKNGYAVNFLIPQKRAVKKTKESLVVLEKQKDEIQKKKEEIASGYKEMGDKLKEIKSIKIEVTVGEDNKIFGSITSKMVVDQIAKDHNFDIHKKYVYLKNNIKLLGAYEVEFRLNKEIKIQSELEIVAKNK